MGLPRKDKEGKKQLMCIGRPRDDIALAEAYEWKDCRALFNTTTGHLRKLQHMVDGSLHVNIAKWERHSPGGIDQGRLWNCIWQLDIALKEECLAWKIAYRAPATNRQRWPTLPRTDERKQCKRCTLLVVESTIHCFWSCAKVEVIWNWVQSILPLTSGDTNQTYRLTTAQALIGDPLDCAPTIPLRWWAALRFPAL